jgi:hypothetical protein
MFAFGGRAGSGRLCFAAALAPSADQDDVSSFARSQSGHSNTRSLKCGPIGLMPISDIRLPQWTQGGGLSASKAAEVKTMSEWGIGQRRQLIWFGGDNHFTGLRINHPDRRSGTLRPEELFTSKLERGGCFSTGIPAFV